MNEEGFVCLSKDPPWAARKEDFCPSLSLRNMDAWLTNASSLLNPFPTSPATQIFQSFFFPSKDSETFLVPC